VIARVRGLAPTAVIRGNHDKAACGIDDAGSFNPAARHAAQWTYDTLTPEHRTYLAELPPGPILVEGGIEICHGSPADEDAYIFDAPEAWAALELTRASLCFFGHTHIAVAFLRSGQRFEAIVPENGETSIQVQNGRRLLVNPGSVGQPRDGDPRAAFAVYQTDGMILFRRVEYNIAEAQRRIAAAGLPLNLANRLAIGR
jgi:diadenosine tetraphosphatase ApaH/serine/threonine PP2A family protein phosphatase